MKTRFHKKDFEHYTTFVSTNRSANTIVVKCAVYPYRTCYNKQARTIAEVYGPLTMHGKKLQHVDKLGKHTKKKETAEHYSSHNRLYVN